MAQAAAPLAIAAIGAGAQVGGAALQGRSTNVPPPVAVFPQQQQQYLNQLSFTGQTSMNSLNSMAATGEPTNVGPAFDAFVASQQRMVGEGRANLQNQFAGMGQYNSSTAMTAATDFEAQTSKDFMSLLEQWSMAAQEAAAGRKLTAAQTGASLASEPALTMFQPVIPGSGAASGALNAGGAALQNLALMKMLFPTAPTPGG